jgi:hypothetical protein
MSSPCSNNWAIGASIRRLDESLEDIANQYVPNLRSSLTLSDSQPVVWVLGKHPNVELKARLDSFVERVQRDGTWPGSRIVIWATRDA